VEIEGFSHIQLIVSDLAASEPWYCDLFGFTRFTAGVSHGRGYVALRHKPSRLVFVLSEGNTDDTGFDDWRIGLNHLALAVPTAEALDQWVAHCDELGVRHDSVLVDAAGGRSLILRDPDGIQLELFVSPPRSSSQNAHTELSAT
jgi:catechol 2,3-dioxygenase-like lactoylglutathione lyase family enzyme